MRVLIVEDDENKRSQLVGFLTEILAPTGIGVARSFQSGLRAVIASEVDLIILDMTMPTFDYAPGEDGGRLQSFGGRDILRQMDRRGLLTPVIVFTAFDRFGDGTQEFTWQELDEQLRAEHPLLYFGAVYYNAARTGWKDDLLARIRATGLLPVDSTS